MIDFTKKFIRNVNLVDLQFFKMIKWLELLFRFIKKVGGIFVLSCFQYHQMPAKMNLKIQKNFRGCGNFWQKVETFCQNHLITLTYENRIVYTPRSAIKSRVITRIPCFGVFLRVKIFELVLQHEPPKIPCFQRISKFFAKFHYFCSNIWHFCPKKTNF